MQHKILAPIPHCISGHSHQPFKINLSTPSSSQNTIKSLLHTGYPYNLMTGTGVVVSTSKGSCRSIGVASTSSVLWIFSELAFSKLNSASSSVSEGGGVWGWKIDYFSLDLVEVFPPRVQPSSLCQPFSLFGIALPIVIPSYRSPLLLDNT